MRLYSSIQAECIAVWFNSAAKVETLSPKTNVRIVFRKG